jgi:hypothetical protein
MVSEVYEGGCPFEDSHPGFQILACSCCLPTLGKREAGRNLNLFTAWQLKLLMRRRKRNGI